MAYRFHRQGDKRIERLEVEVAWSPAYQSYFSAGDDSEAYCVNCDENLECDWSYCPNCGGKLITFIQFKPGIIYKEYGVK